METISYTVSGTTTEVSFASFGVGLSVSWEMNTHGESKMRLPLDTLPPETAVAIPYAAQCIIYTGRTWSGTAWTGGSILFQGRRTDNSGSAGPSGAKQELVIEDAWFDLKLITLFAAWQHITAFTTSTPTLGTPYSYPDCVLFQATSPGPFQPDGSFGTYSPAPVYGHITTGQSIAEILAWAIYSAAINLQIGTIDPAAYVPFYPVRTMKCADAIKVCLRPHPDCVCEIDYTTTPPTFNVRKRSNLTAITLPYKSSSSITVGSVTAKRTHLTSTVRPRPDLQVNRVGLYLKSTATVDGQPVVSVGTDIYPSGASSWGSLDASIDMSGPKVANLVAPLTTAAFDPTSLTWWAAKVPALRSLSAGGQLPNSGTGALALVDSTINTSGHLKGIKVVDSSGAAINLSTFAYEITAGNVCSWMTLSGGSTAVQWVEATITAFFYYTKTTALGSASFTDQVTEHPQSIRVKLTNSPSATYTKQVTLTSGEQYPGGFAQSIYNSLATLQYDFKHTILEDPFLTVIKPGKHCLNLSGGASDWTSMNAMVQSVSIDLQFNTGTGKPTARTTVNCGPVAHLEPARLFELFNLFTNRDLSRINPYERSSGQALGGGNAGLGNDGPKENSSTGNAVLGIQNFANADGTLTGKFDVVNGLLSIASPFTPR